MITTFEVLRKAHRLSAQKLLAQIGYAKTNHPTIYRVERRKIKAPKRLREKSAQFFKVREEILFDEDGFAKELNVRELIRYLNGKV